MTVKASSRDCGGLLLFGIAGEFVLPAARPATVTISKVQRSKTRSTRKKFPIAGMSI
jgi:hypothetical protein